MIDQSNIETTFHVIDEVATFFSEKKQLRYLDGVVKACLILSKDEEADCDGLGNIIIKMSEIEPKPEELRKAYQLAVLKAFRSEFRSNALVTPDTIGIFISYLIGKLMPKRQNMVVFDPLVGSGNLLATVADNLGKAIKVIGIDNDQDCAMLAGALMKLIGQDADIRLAETCGVKGIGADVIITDFPFAKETDEEYFPYKVLNSHHENLKSDGYVIAVIPNDFFDVTEARDYRKTILDKYTAVGLIKLPDDLFRKLGKSILILKKKNETPKKKDENFLVASIPSFVNSEEFKKTLGYINDWFDRHIDKREDE
ncbi:MAG TPA: N-6 DNA methylase [Candidatus Izemoplasmatales bacterium]|nr:N-6 DNA methylase [Candidatus Izemoplasmatales bacterium]